MRRQLNTLYITTEGAWLRKDGANVVMNVEGKERARLPIHMLESLVCFGRVLVSPPLMGFCAEQGVTITHLSPNGKFLARIEGPVSGNVLLRRTQYRTSDDEVGCAAIVRGVLIGKVHNQRAVISRGLRDYGSKLAPAEREGLERACTRLSRIARDLLREPLPMDCEALKGRLRRSISASSIVSSVMTVKLSVSPAATAAHRVIASMRCCPFFIRC